MTLHLPKRTHSGFTLIELLVVIGILTVLMGLLFPVVNGVKEQANKAKAKSDVMQLVNSVRNYYTEYGKYPVDPAQNTTTDTVFTAATFPRVLNVLRYSGTTDSQVVLLNPRGVSFMEVPAVKDAAAPKSGVNATGTWFDPWGVPYHLAMDTNYDNNLNSTDSPLASFYTDENFKPINTGVVAWSYGKDKAIGTKGNSKYNRGDADDVISWQ